jgi:ribonuclease III
VDEFSKINSHSIPLLLRNNPITLLRGSGTSSLVHICHTIPAFYRSTLQSVYYPNASILSIMDQDKIRELEDRLGHNFTNQNELIRALTHPAYSKEQKERKKGARDCPNQETYATLGDAVIRVVFVWLLMEQGLKTKGDITILKADLENNLKLAEVGERLHLLEDHLILHNMGDGEELKKGRETLLSDTVEALIGAIFIDTDHSLPETKECIAKIFEPELQKMNIKSSP